jgi:uridine kinase
MFGETEVCEMKGFVLIAGLSKAGKSTFADNFCQSIPQSTHVPLDKYFKEVPQGLTFLSWVQSPDSIDWTLLREHIELLKDGYDCYTPVLDWRQTGRRVSQGGLKGHHASRKMTGGAKYYVIPGCFAFKFPNPGAPVVRVFIDTPRRIIETRREWSSP